MRRRKQEPKKRCGDCIHLCACSAWNLGTLDNADATHCINYDTGESWCSWCKLKRAAMAEGKMPSESMTWVGRWIGVADGFAEWYCSECGVLCEDWDKKPTWKYCPNCGAKMEGEK